MCGIIGGYDRQRRPFGTELADVACRRMQHRGPDDQGHYETDGVLIGNRRLSILGLADGHQPMCSDDGEIVVVQNGEIYNFVELSAGLGCRTKCDTEVILRLYEREGERFVERLNGMFAIAIFDRRKHQLLLFRDRVGKKPLYLYDDGKRLLFASEIKSLLAMGVTPELSWEGLNSFLTFNYVPPPGTIFKGIRHLLPGHMLRIDDSGCEERPWWELNVEPEEKSEHQWRDEVLSTLEDAVRVRLRSDVPLGAFLSGGLDSSVIVKLMADQLDRPVTTYCIGLEDEWFQDARFAAEAAAHCGAEHHCEVVQADLAHAWPLTVYHNDQPHGDISFLPTYLVSKLARQQLKVVLTGDGSDELFAGYDLYQQVQQRTTDASQSEFEEHYLNAISLFSATQRRELLSQEANSQLEQHDPLDVGRMHLPALRRFDRVNQMLGLDLKLLMPGNNLVKPDRMAMAVSLEARAPFMDYRLVDLAFKIPGRFKIREQEGKWILKQAAESLLPKSIIYRPKQMFTMPVGKWLRGPLLPFVRETLLSQQSVAREIFNANVVEAMLDDHVQDKHDWTRQLRALIVFELWHRTFLGSSFESSPTYEDLGISSFPRTMNQAALAAA